MPGPSKTPIHIKKLRGTLRKSDIPDNPIKLSEMEQLPKCPSYILGGLDKQSKIKEEIISIWDSFMKDAKRMGLLDTISLFQVEDYFFNYRVWRENAEIVAKEGAVTDYNDGQAKGLSAHFKVMQAARKPMKDFEDRWGLNPSSKSKIDLPEPARERDEFLDPLDI